VRESTDVVLRKAFYGIYVISEWKRAPVLLTCPLLSARALARLHARALSRVAAALLTRSACFLQRERERCECVAERQLLRSILLRLLRLWCVSYYTSLQHSLLHSVLQSVLQQSASRASVSTLL
jgi:hypothetical protein